MNCFDKKNAPGISEGRPGKLGNVKINLYLSKIELFVFILLMHEVQYTPLKCLLNL